MKGVEFAHVRAEGDGYGFYVRVWVLILGFHFSLAFTQVNNENVGKKMQMKKVN